MNFEQPLTQLGAHLAAQQQLVTDLQRQVLLQRIEIEELRKDLESLRKPVDPVDPPPEYVGPATNTETIQEFNFVHPDVVSTFNQRFGGKHVIGMHRHVYHLRQTLRLTQHTPLMHADGRLSWNFIARRPAKDHGQVIPQDLDHETRKLPEGMFLRKGVTYQISWSTRWDGHAWPASWVQLCQAYGMHGAGNQSDGRKDQVAVFVDGGEVRLITHDREGRSSTAYTGAKLLTNIWYRFAIELRASGGEDDFARLWMSSNDEPWLKIAHQKGAIGTGVPTSSPDGYLEPRVGFYASDGMHVQGSVKDISTAEIVG